MVELTAKTFLIVCPLCFLAGLVDAIAGGGGLISLPSYLIGGIPIHMAIGTNKLSSSFGAVTSVFRFTKNKMINFKLGIPSVIFAIIGSGIGANLSVIVEEAIMLKILFVVLPVTAFIVLNRHLFHDNPGAVLIPDPKTFVITLTVAFVLGVYDGFFGPGTGTFSIILLTVLAKMSIVTANAQTKLINMTTNLTSLTVFLLKGQTIVLLGVAAGICNLIGSWIGTGLALKNAGRITKPVIIMVLIILAIRIFWPVE